MPDTEKRPLSMNAALAQAQAKMRELDPNGEDDELEDEAILDETELGGAPPDEEEPGAVATATTQAPTKAPTQAAAPAADAPPTTTTSDGQPAAPPDPWAETVDIEYVDGDKKYVVRAPKEYADHVKNGYSRRQLMDRALGQFGKNKAFLEQLATSGQLDQVIPYVQAFTTDQQLAEAAAEILARRKTGRPIRFADETQPAEPVSFEEVKLPDLSQYDEYTAGAVKSALEPIVQAFNEERKYRAQTTTQQTAAQQRAEAQRAQEAQLANLGSQVRFELQRRFGNVFGEDVVPYQRLQQFVEQNGYVQMYGLTPGAWLIAAQDMMANGELAAPQAPPATTSAAAAVIRETEQAAQALSRGARAAVASAVAPGTAGAAAPAPQKPKTPPRFVKMANGKTRPITPKEQADWLAKNGRAS